jgi:hypothetical protein
MPLLRLLVSDSKARMKLNILLANLRIVHKKDVREILDNGHTIKINHDMGGT